MDSKLLSVDEFSQRYGIPIWTIRSYCSNVRCLISSSALVCTSDPRILTGGFRSTPGLPSQYEFQGGESCCHTGKCVGKHANPVVTAFKRLVSQEGRDARAQEHCNLFEWREA
jgi:hypothetical protein